MARDQVFMKLGTHAYQTFGPQPLLVEPFLRTNAFFVLPPRLPPQIWYWYGHSWNFVSLGEVLSAATGAFVFCKQDVPEKMKCHMLANYYLREFRKYVQTSDFVIRFELIIDHIELGSRTGKEVQWFNSNQLRPLKSKPESMMTLCHKNVT